MSEDSVPPRKGVTAWEIEPMEENGDEFFVLTFHHGLGRMTRLDLDTNDVRELAQLLARAAESNQNADPDAIFVVMSNDERDDEGLPLYWSNEQGWTDAAGATRFTEEETRRFNLPLGDCFWAKLAVTNQKETPF